MRIDPDRAVVHVDGNRVVLRDDQVYLALNKLPGMLSTMSDELDRPHIGQLLEDWRRRRNPAVPRRPARHGLRGAAAADQRRRAGPPADPPVVRRDEDLHGRDPRPGSARPGSAAARGRRAGRRTGEGRLLRRGRRAQQPGRRRGGAARGTQAHRPADARRGRPPGVPAGPHQDRRGPARPPASRHAAAAEPGGDLACSTRRSACDAAGDGLRRRRFRDRDRRAFGYRQVDGGPGSGRPAGCRLPRHRRDVPAGHPGRAAGRGRPCRR